MLQVTGIEFISYALSFWRPLVQLLFTVLILDNLANTTK